jgi:pimeloyl-ACP methyl ester carboxylesterase
MPVSKINGVNLFWEMSGDKGPPLILVHGSWGDHHNWDAVVPELAKEFRVTFYDRRGHSLSERPGGQGKVNDDVNDLAELIRHLDIDPVNIVGNSFGAVITLKLAATSPELFKTMSIHEPPMFPLLDGEATTAKPLQIVGERINAVINLLKEKRNEKAAELFVETIASGPGSWKNLPPQLQATFVFNAPTWLDEMQDDDSLRIDLTKLKNFSRPVFISQGEFSPPFFPAVIGKILTSLPHAERKTFGGAGHIPHITHPKEYVEVLMDFILRNN